ncbi:hypothetical protein [Prosthecobacter sp.]|uniref:hypothetical protein n=1 Tax=Prosthecobacter sp. TaxID=1965333 RepID=UPI0024898EC9|nr:hypothetical protein [Prosthecobacter sp.]MDI1312108.1 hypothetical protein [Prosthecobacter sp.]
MLAPTTTHPGLARWTNLFSLLVIGIGSAVLAGWIFDVSFLKRILPGSIAMKFNTALVFVLAGLSLRGAAVCRSPCCRRMGQLCAGLVILIGGLTLVEHISGVDLGIDNRLLQEQARATSKYTPGRMSSQTAVSFVFFGVALLLSASRRRGWWNVVSRALLACVAFIALASLVGHLFGFMFQVGISQITGMAIHTSLAFLLLCAGLYCARHEAGEARDILFSETTGGIMARRLLPGAILMPLLLGWLGVGGRKSGLYDTPAGTAFFVVCTLAFFTVLVLATARQLHLLDLARRAAVDARDQMIAELQRSFDEVRTLQGLLPMCAWCKKIRDDQGYWDDVASYIAKHTEASVSHGICPECSTVHFPATPPA